MALNFLKSEENLSWDFLQKCGFNYMPISQRFFYLQENIKYFLKFFIPDTKNHRNPLHRSC